MPKSPSLTTSSTELPPELSALEAALASVQPKTDIAVCERFKAAALLETCRLTQPELPNLVETIVDAGEPGITVSLRRYIKMERFQAMVLGIVLGLLAGAVINLIGLVMTFRYLLQ